MASTAAGRRLALPIVLAFASTSLPIMAVGLVMGVYLPRFFAGHVGLSMAAVGGAFALVRIIDLVLDPLLGMLMDRTKTRFGRYRPWLVLGAPITMLAVFELFFAEKGLTEFGLISWLLILYLGVSILTLSQAAWGASIATGYHDRSRVYGIVYFVGVVGAVMILMLPVAFGAGDKGAETVRLMGWFLLAMIPLTVLLSVVVTPETVAPNEKRDRVSLKEYWNLIRRPDMLRLIGADFFMALGPGTTAALYLFFFHDARHYTHAQTGVLLIFFIAAGLLGALFWSRVAQKLGKHRTLILSSFCYAVFQAALMMIPPATMSLAIPGMAAVGFVSSAFLLIVRAMVADVADEVRLETGQERSGLLYALVTTTQKAGSAITVAVSFAILGMVGYDASEGATNTAAAIRGLELCYVFAPVILVFAGAASLLGYKLNAARHAEIRRELDARDAIVAEAELLETASGAPVAAASRTA